MADDIGGVWRTIGGRRVFIKTGQSLSSAMKASGKFKRLKKKKEEEDSDPRSAIAYHLKKGEFDKAEEYLKEYGLEDEREEFAEGLNYEAQKDYKNYLAKTREFEKERDEINNKRGRQYDEAKKIQDVKGARGTDYTNSGRYIVENNPNVKKPYKEVRLDRYRAFDNGYILHNYEENKGMQMKAKEASLKNPNDIHYVHYDDIMEPTSSTRWYEGKPYTISEAQKINQKINARNEIKYFEKKLAEAYDIDDKEDIKYYRKKLKLAEEQYYNIK